jgi:AP-2 complex subunit beta-1
MLEPSRRSLCERCQSSRRYECQHPVLGYVLIVQDLNDPNPLIRALALRTISYVHVKEFVEGTIPQLRKMMEDSDPYVRKHAAMTVAKVYDHDKRLVENSDLIERLNRMLKDENATVIASALAALTDIWERSENIKLTIDYTSASKIVSLLPDVNEWCQAYILEAMTSYVPQTTDEATLLAERILPRLSHSNSGVVLNCIRVIMYLMNYIDNQAKNTEISRKLSPPLVTLLSKPAEIQYLALRNAILILQQRPDVLPSDIRVFFCKYNDPIYVKVTKLELIFMLANKDNIDIVLNELKEYATEIDVQFVRKAVRAIGKLAIKIEPAARQCIDALLELVNARIPYIVQEATVVIKNIFRKYPNQYEGIISTVIGQIDELDEPEAKAAIIWIIGQYADRIDNADSLLQDYLATFHEEPTEVQLALLTATVKLFLQRPAKGSSLVPQVLKWCTEEIDDPDLRDRGFMYWRLLSTDPKAAKDIVMGTKPPITADSEKLDPTTLEELCLCIGTLATIYLKPVQQVFRSARARKLTPSPALQKRKEDFNAAMSTTSLQVNTQPREQQDAIAAADEYFKNLSLSNNIDNFASPTTGAQSGFVVNQNAAQQIMQPVGGAQQGDLLL